MDGLPKVWCSDLQSALEMLSQGVIINNETGYLGVAKHVFLEMLAEYPGDRRHRARHPDTFGPDEASNTQGVEQWRGGPVPTICRWSWR